jgi:hypothetical protein
LIVLLREKIHKTVFGIIEKEVRKGRNVKLPGFGTFYQHDGEIAFSHSILMKEEINKMKQVKELSEFQHKGGGKYIFLTIAHPLSEKPRQTPVIEQRVFHTEMNEWITLYNYKNVCFTSVDEYLVIYQSEEDEDAEHLWARPVNMFFEHVEEKGKFVRLFNQIS